MQISICNAIGSGIMNLVASIISSFTSRVTADSGTFEAQSCLDDTLTKLNNI